MYWLGHKLLRFRILRDSRCVTDLSGNYYGVSVRSIIGFFQ